MMSLYEDQDFETGSDEEDVPVEPREAATPPRLPSLSGDPARVQSNYDRIVNYAERAERFEITQRAKAHNAAARKHTAATGAQYQRDESGLSQPVIDSATGQQRHTPRTSPVRKDSQGRPYQVKTDETGRRDIVNPDADATWEENKDDPEDTHIYKVSATGERVKYDPEEGIMSGDRRLAAESARALHKRELAKIANEQADIALKKKERELKGLGKMTDEQRQEAISRRDALAQGIPRPEPKKGWGGGMDAEGTARKEAEWMMLENDRKAQLAKIEASLADDDERRGMEQRSYDLAVRQKDLRDMNVAGYLKKRRDEAAQSLANLPGDVAAVAVGQRAEEIDALDSDLSARRTDLERRHAELEAATKGGYTIDKIGEIDRQRAELTADAESLNADVERRNLLSEQLNTGLAAREAKEKAERKAEVEKQRKPLRDNPDTAQFAEELDAFDEEAEKRMEAVRAMPAGNDKTAAAKALHEDLEKRQREIIESNQAKIKEQAEKRAELRTQAESLMELEDRAAGKPKPREDFVSVWTGGTEEGNQIEKIETEKAAKQLKESPPSPEVKAAADALREENRIKSVAFESGRGYVKLPSGEFALNPLVMSPKWQREGLGGWREQLQQAEEAGDLTPAQRAIWEKNIAAQEAEARDIAATTILDNATFQTWLRNTKPELYKQGVIQDSPAIREAAGEFLDAEPTLASKIWDKVGRFWEGAFQQTGADLATAAGVLSHTLFGWSGGKQIEDNFFYQLGQGADEAMRMQRDPRMDESGWSTFATVVGGAAGFMLPSVGVGKVAEAGRAAKLLKLAKATNLGKADKAAELARIMGGAEKSLGKITTASVMTQGALQNGAQLYKEARAAGLDHNHALLPFVLGGVIGLSEALPISKWIGRLGKPKAASAWRIVTNMLTEAVEESLQEGGQQLSSNAVARMIYDKNRDLLEGVGGGALAGGEVGAFMAFLTSSIGNARARRYKKRTGREPQEEGVPRESSAPGMDMFRLGRQVQLAVKQEEGNELTNDETVEAAFLDSQPTARQLAEFYGYKINPEAKDLGIKLGGTKPLPEKIAAANAQIDSWDPPEALTKANADIERTAARAALKILSRQPVSALVAAERFALTRKMPDGTPRMEILKGKPVITDGQLRRLATVAPDAADMPFLPEAVVRQKILNSVSQESSEPSTESASSAPTPAGAQPQQKDTHQSGDTEASLSLRTTGAERQRVSSLPPLPVGKAGPLVTEKERQAAGQIKERLVESGVPPVLAEGFARYYVRREGTDQWTPDRADDAVAEFERAGGHENPKAIREAITASDNSQKEGIEEIHRAAVEGFGEAYTKLPEEERKKVDTIIRQRIAPELLRYRGAFQKIVGGIKSLGGAGAAVGAGDGKGVTFRLNLEDLLKENNQQEWKDDVIAERTVNEEVAHSANVIALAQARAERTGETGDVLTMALQEGAEIWGWLPKQVQGYVHKIYGKQGAELSGMEFFRMLLQNDIAIEDGKFVTADGKILTEQASPTLLKKLKDVFRNLIRVFAKLETRLREEFASQGLSKEEISARVRRVRKIRTESVKIFREFQKTGDEARVAAYGKEYGDSNPASAQDGGRGVDNSEAGIPGPATATDEGGGGGGGGGQGRSSSGSGRGDSGLAHRGDGQGSRPETANQGSVVEQAGVSDVSDELGGDSGTNRTLAQAEKEIEALEQDKAERIARDERIEDRNLQAPSSKPPASNWVNFTPDTGTLGVPRAEMPQIPSESRGALVNFLEARGITATTETVPADSLKPTQAEYSPKKVEKAESLMGGTQRKLLVSADGHLLDGHHQWLASRGGDVEIMRLSVPVREALAAISELPSAATAVAAEASSQKVEVGEPLTPDSHLLASAAARAAADEIIRRADEAVSVVSIPEQVPSLKRAEAMRLLSTGEHSIIGSHPNEDSGLNFEVDGVTLAKTVAQPRKDGEPEGAHRVRIAAAYSLPEIIRKAIAVPVPDSMPERGGKSVRDLYSALTWKGILYRVRIKGIETTDGKHHARSLKVQDILIEDAPSTAEAMEGAGSSATDESARRSAITIRDLFRSVNPYDGSRMGTKVGNAVITPPGEIVLAAAAFHGTPHHVDRFTTEKIGFGEGHQAYGWGLYFAENPKVAEKYQKGLTERDFIRKVQDAYGEWDTPEGAIEALDQAGLSDAQMGLVLALQKEDWWGFDYPHQAVQAALREPDAFEHGPEVDAALREFGNVYSVDLDVEPDTLLDWDSREQSPKVREALHKIYGETGFSDLGRFVYKELAGGAGESYGGGTPEAASRLLAQAGISGIRYLDQESRRAGEGTSNYVIFDESKIRITHKNGEAVTLDAVMAPAQIQARGAEPSANNESAAKQAAADGEKHAAKRFHENLPLAMHIASKFTNIPGVTANELQQQARLALADAARNFDAGRGKPFAAMAGMYVRNRLRSLYRSETTRATRFPMSLDEPLSEGDPETHGDYAEDTRTPSAVDAAAAHETRRMLDAAIASLPAPMQKAVNGFYEERTLEEIGRELGGVSKQRVGVLQQAAFRRLRGKLGEQGVAAPEQILARGAADDMKPAMTDAIAEGGRSGVEVGKTQTHDSQPPASAAARAAAVDAVAFDEYRDISDEIFRSLPREQADRAREFQNAAQAIERRAGSQAGGKTLGAGQTAALIAWADAEGRLIPAEEIDDLPVVSNSTSEHEVHYREADGRAIKRTWPGFYGQVPVPERDRLGRKNASPAEYLRRMAWQIAVFGSDLQLEGISISDKPSMIIGQSSGEPSLVISQGWLEQDEGQRVDIPEIKHRMEADGFESVPGSYFGWYHPATGIVVVDAKPDNFIATRAGIEPLDLQMLRFTPMELKQAGLEWVQAATNHLFHPESRETSQEAMEELSIRAPMTKLEAVTALSRILGKEMVNAETGTVGIVNRRQVEKLTSNAAVNKSMENGFARVQHYAAAAKIESLWKHGTLVEDREDKHGDPNIKSIKRFVAPLVIDGQTQFAVILAKETEEHGHRVYTLELQEIKTLRGMLDTLSEKSGKRTPTRSVTDTIRHITDKVNPESMSVGKMKPERNWVASDIAQGQPTSTPQSGFSKKLPAEFDTVNPDLREPGDGSPQILARSAQEVEKQTRLARMAEARLTPPFREAMENDAVKGYPGLEGLTPAKGLTREERAVEAHFAQIIAANPEGFTERYRALAKQETGHDGYVNADMARDLYGPYRNNQEMRAFLEKATIAPAGYVALNLAWKNALRRSEADPRPDALIVAGGMASGKSTRAVNVPEARQEAAVIYDSVLGNYERAKAVIGQVKDAGLFPKIVFVWRPFGNAVDGMLGRLVSEGRPVSVRSMAEGHFNAQQVFLRLADEFAGDAGISFSVRKNFYPGDKRVVSVDALRAASYGNSDGSTSDSGERGDAGGTRGQAPGAETPQQADGRGLRSRHEEPGRAGRTPAENPLNLSGTETERKAQMAAFAARKVQAAYDSGKITAAQARAALYGSSTAQAEATPQILARSAEEEDGSPIDDLLRDLDAEINDWQQAALAEEAAGGTKTIGRPDLAHGADNADQRGVDQVYTDNFEPETHEQWEKEARAMVDRDFDGTRKAIQEAGFNGRALTPEQTKAADIISNDLRRRWLASGEAADHTAYNLFAYSYRGTGAEASRALSARQDPLKSPAERHREFLLEYMTKPRKEAQKEIDAAPSESEKNARIKELKTQLAEATRQREAERVKRIRAELALEREKKTKEFLVDEETAALLNKLKEAGITPQHVLQERVVFSLHEKNTRNMLLQVLARSKKEVRQLALRLIWRNRSFEEIAKTTGLSEAEVRRIKSDSVALIRRKDFNLFLHGATADAPNVATGRHVEQAVAEREFAKWLKKLGFVEDAEQGRPAFSIEDAAHIVRMARAIQSARGEATFGDMAYEAWIMNILSGVKTHVANITGNAVSGALDMTLQRGMEALINLAIRDPKAASFGEFKHLLSGLLPGFSKGITMGAKAWSAEHDFYESTVLGTPLELERADKLGGTKASIPGAAGKTIRIPGRGLLFMDSLFKTSLGQMEAGAQAYRIAKSEGLSGAALERRVAMLMKTRGEILSEYLGKTQPTKAAAEHFARRLARMDSTLDVEELVDDRTSEAWERAHEQAAYDAAKRDGWKDDAWQTAVKKARELTFQQDLLTTKKGGNVVEDLASKLQDARYGNKLAGFFFPFVRTPYNIFRVGLRKSPLGTLNLLNQLRKGLWGMNNGTPYLTTHPELVRDLAEQTLAWVAMALLWGAAQGDDDDDDKLFLITGSMPRTLVSRGERDLNARATGGDYVIRIGGRNGMYINYGRIEPIATVLGATVDMIRGIKRQGTTRENMAQVWNYIVANVNSKSFLQGLENISALMEGRDDPVGQVKRMALQALVPNLIRQPLRSLDDYVRDGKLAGLEYELFPTGALAEPKINPYGEAIRKGSNPVLRLFFDSPLEANPTLQQTDKALLRWNRNNPNNAWAPQEAGTTYKNRRGQAVQMTAEEARKYRTIAGRRAVAKLRGIVTPLVMKNPTEKDIQRIRDAFADARREAREYLFGFN